MSTTWINRGHFYVPHVTPVVVDCKFQVAPADTAGLGILAGSLKGQGVNNVFMHTSATPGSNNGVLNPNPAAGLITVQLSDNFSRLYGFFAAMSPPLTGSNVLIDASDALLVVGKLYQITVLGTSTAADWLTIGVPPGIIPAVGVSFIAIATGAGVGTGAVQLSAAAGSGIGHIEVMSDSSLTLAPVPVGGSPHVGGYVNLLCYADSSTSVFTYNSGTPASSTVATTTANALTAPATGTIIRLAFYLSQSSVTVLGE